uniref:Putative secreted protein n=1 Tax=Panstrongylus lignarius TaxID=156445 RepID=A0A224Y4V3_9HEMI
MNVFGSLLFLSILPLLSGGGKSKSSILFVRKGKSRRNPSLLANTPRGRLLALHVDEKTVSSKYCLMNCIDRACRIVD